MGSTDKPGFMGLDEFFEGYTNEAVEIRQTLREYYTGLIQNRDIFGKRVTTEMIDDFQSLTKLWKIFCTAFIESKNENDFMEVFEETYLKIAGKEILYLKFFGHAWLLASILQKDYKYIKKTDYEKSLVKDDKIQPILIDNGRKRINDVHSNVEPSTKKLHVSCIQNSSKVTDPRKKAIVQNNVVVQKTSSILKTRIARISETTFSSVEQINRDTHNFNKRIVENESHFDKVQNSDNIQDNEVADFTEDDDDDYIDDMLNDVPDNDLPPVQDPENFKKTTCVRFDEETQIFTVGTKQSTAVESLINTTEHRSSEVLTKRHLPDAFVVSEGPSEDVKVSVDKPEGKIMAVPYSMITLPLPLKSRYENWRSEHNMVPEIMETLKKFSHPLNSSLQTGKKLKYLFIYDTLLKPANICKNFENAEVIDLSYPLKYSSLFDAFQEVRREKLNAYVIDKIFICYGTDIAIRGVNIEECLTNIRIFIKKLLIEIRKEFDTKSPLRYKDIQAFKPLFPKFYFITIPYADSPNPHVMNFNKIFKIINDYFKDIVKSDFEMMKRGIDFELIDWNDAVEKGDRQKIEEYELRYVELNNLLVNNATLFMKS